VTTELSAGELATMFARVERDLALADADSALQVLVHSALDMVPGAQMAGVSVGRGGRFSTRAATDEAVRLVDQLQYDANSGPCVDAIVQDATFNARDLRTDPRWPEFGRAAFTQAGIVSMLSFRMFFEGHDAMVAGLNLYSREPDAFGDRSQAIGLLLATHGALAVGQTVARAKADNLTVALKTSREIGMAMGILMEKYKITRDESFDLLRMASQALHQKLADIACLVADTGELPALPRRATARHGAE
jgi:hypothetical protein